jgi:hypothetical protein
VCSPEEAVSFITLDPVALSPDAPDVDEPTHGKDLSSR